MKFINFGKKIAALSLSAALLVSLGACSTDNTQKDTNKDEANSVTGSKKVMLYSSLKEDQLTALKEGFTKKYPDIVMDYYAAGTGKVLTKIATEQQSGTVSADLIWVGDPSNYISFKEKGMLEAYVSPEAQQIPDVFKDKDNFYIGARLIVVGLSYNTNLVKENEIPKSWKDLIKPEFKNQIVVSDPAEAGTTMYAIAGLVNHPDYGWEFMGKLKENGVELESGTSSTINKVGAGAYKVCIGVDYVTKTLEAQGSTIKFSYPEKDIVAVSSPIAILKNAPNLEEAKLLYDFILSEEGQNILAAHKATPIRKGIKQDDGSLDAQEIADRSMPIDENKLVKEKQEILDKFDKLFK